MQAANELSASVLLVHVEREPGQGATFLVGLPCLPPGEDAPGGEA
ncbi:MAG TPA: hypothetical protein VF794_31785 [Archangium sp.]|jgi:hypothetical protein